MASMAMEIELSTENDSNPRRLNEFPFFHKLKSSCPPSRGSAGILTVILIIASLWATAYIGSGLEMNTNSESFSVLVLLTTCLLGGKFTSLFKLPPLLGMLLVGLILGNCSSLPASIQQSTSTAIRNLSLVVILLRGALGLDPEVLRTHFWLIMRISFLPCLMETVSWGIGAFLILDIPWLEAFMLGFLMSAASAAVVIPLMLQFAERGLGAEKGISTIAIAAMTIDNVVAMTAFGIMHSLAYSTRTLLATVGGIPVQLLVGSIFGLIWGGLVSVLPSIDQRLGHVTGGRFALLLLGGIVAIFGGRALNYPGAGPLACLTSGLVANTSWRQRSGWGKQEPKNPVAEMLGGLWILFEPLLFGLIGSQIILGQLEPRLVGFGLLVMFLALLIRAGLTYAASFGRLLTASERLFMVISWMPKATVQAALGPAALETVHLLQLGDQAERIGSNILALSVISILVTGPLGAVAMQCAGPRLLRKKATEDANDTSAEQDYTAI